MSDNEKNPNMGKTFQERMEKIARNKFGIDFVQEKGIPIGIPAKLHRFDIVSIDSKIVIECKYYTWTSGNNVPSAKLSTLNEAVLYMRNLPGDTKKIIAMKKDIRKSTSESLAAYYCRNYGHLLDDIRIWEVDDFDNVTVVR